MLPLEIILIPTFLIVQQLNLLNTLFGLMLPLVIDGFGIFMMRQFIKDIPNSCKTIEICRLGLRSRQDFEYVPNSCKTIELCKIAVELGCHLKDIPDSCMTIEICQIACKNGY